MREGKGAGLLLLLWFTCSVPRVLLVHMNEFEFLSIQVPTQLQRKEKCCWESRHLFPPIALLT